MKVNLVSRIACSEVRKLADAYLEKFGGDNLAETRSNKERFLQSVGWTALA